MASGSARVDSCAQHCAASRADTSLRCRGSGHSAHALIPLTPRTFRYLPGRRSQSSPMRLTVPPPCTARRSRSASAAGCCPDAGSPATPHRSRCAPAPAPDGPTSASNRRTSRLRPSCKVTRTSVLPGTASITAKSSTATGPSSNSTPARSCLSQSTRHRSVHGGQIGLRYLVGRMHQPVRQLPVVGQQNQAFGVSIEPPDVQSISCCRAPGARSSLRCMAVQVHRTWSTASRAACSSQGEPACRRA